MSANPRASFGEIKGPVQAEQPKPKANASMAKYSASAKTGNDEIIEYIREDYAGIIRQARERKGL